MLVAPLLLLLLPVPGADSSPTSPLTTGTRVRVTVRDGGSAERRYVGPLRTFDGSELTLVPEGSGQHVALSRSTITRIEVFRGRGRQAGRGALVGAVIGLAAIAIAESACGEDCESPDNYGLVVAGSVAGGALAGAAIGAMIGRERWESQPWALLPGRRAAVTPGLKITLRF